MISGFHPLKLNLERGQATLSLIVFTIEVSNIISCNIIKSILSTNLRIIPYWPFALAYFSLVWGLEAGAFINC